MNPSYSLPKDNNAADSQKADALYTAPVVQELSFVGTAIHYPHFWPNSLPTGHDVLKSLQQHLETSHGATEWLPQPLLDEIESCFPSDEDIDRDVEGQRCPQAFSHNINKFFKKGRIFMNYKQLVAAGQLLLDAWAVSSSHGAKSLSCYFGAPLGKAMSSSGPKRQLTASPKTLCCPFRVSYQTCPGTFLHIYAQMIPFSDPLFIPQC